MSRFIDSFGMTMGRGVSSYERLLKSAFLARGVLRRTTPLVFFKVRASCQVVWQDVDALFGRPRPERFSRVGDGSTIDVIRTIELYVHLQETLRGRDSCSCGHVQDWREPILKLADGATSLTSPGVHCREVAACWNTSALESHQVRHLAGRLGAHQTTEGNRQRSRTVRSFSPSRGRMGDALSPWTPSVAAKTNIRPPY